MRMRLSTLPLISSAVPVVSGGDSVDSRKRVEMSAGVG